MERALGVTPTVWVEQAIFTSIPRRGRAGYHVVARSPGVPEADANALATWAPSHGALIVDAANRTSVNFHPVPSGRLALSRTCEGPAEYSGRGERQLYTHALIFDIPALHAVGSQPLALYRDALAQGHLRYQREPDTVLKPVQLGVVHPVQDYQALTARTRMMGLALEPIAVKLASGQEVRFHFPGDRIDLAECVLGLLPPEVVPEASFSTSLQPSAVRPYRLLLIN